MDARERILAAMAWEEPDQVPLTIYDWMIPTGAAERELRQRVLDLRLRLDNLRILLAGLQIRGDYRELYLARSRALYELEVKTDLGDAMTEITTVHFDRARAEFEWTMTQAELAALRGRLLPEEQAQ